MNFKRNLIGAFVIGIFVVGILVFTSVSALSLDINTDKSNANAEKSFTLSDVNKSNENYNAIYFLYNTGVIDGYKVEGNDSREYRPDQEINRAEFLKLLLKDSEADNYKTEKVCFPDVPKDVWYTPYVCYAKEYGYIKGYPDGKFKPGNTINKVEALRMAGEILKWAVAKNGEDAAGGNWYKPYLDYALSKKFTTSVGLDSLMDRGEIAEILFRNVEVATLGLDYYNKDYDDELFAMFEFGDTIEDGIASGGSSSGNSDEDLGEGSSEDVGENSSETADKTASYLLISLNKNSITADGVDYLKMTVNVKDKDGNLLSDRDVTVKAATGIDYLEYLPVYDEGEGVYTVSFSSTLAGTFHLYATDEKSGISEEKTITALPGVLDHVEVIDVVYPHENDLRNQAILKVTGKDKFENVLPYSSVGNNLSATTSLGTVSVSHDSDGIFTMEVTTDDWGIAHVSIVKKGTPIVLSEKDTEIFFLPVELDMPKGIESDAGQISVPMYVYFPGEYGDLGSYEYDVKYDPEVLEFVDVEDYDTSDNFATPYIDVDEVNGVIHLWQSNSNIEMQMKEDVGVGALLFNVASTGDGAIYVDNIVLVNTQEEQKCYLMKFAELIGETAESIEEAAKEAAEAAEEAAKTAEEVIEAAAEVVEAAEDAIGNALSGAFKWMFGIKDSKDICIDAFIFPGSGATNAAVTQDVASANAIFTKIAKSCNCKFYLNFRVNSVKVLTAAEWTAVDANGDGNLDITELNNTVNSHPASGSCVPVYYPPAIDGGALGWSWEGATEGIAMSHARDADNRTLAHELSHQLSQGNVQDPNNLPASATQGADTAGNLMNYTNTGDDLTRGQCQLIEAQLP